MTSGKSVLMNTLVRAILRALGVDFLKDVTPQQKTRIARMHSW
jgi:hypothetical protein